MWKELEGRKLQAQPRVMGPDEDDGQIEAMGGDHVLIEFGVGL